MTGAIITFLSLSLHQLVSMDWQLGMAMSSSSCRSLNSPYVTLQLNVADPSGSLQQRTLQMTVSEFQVTGVNLIWISYSSFSPQSFASQLKDMASALETAA